MSFDERRMAYKRLLFSFSNALGAKEIRALAYFYDLGKESSDAEAGALEVMLKLERLDVFSFEEPRGLVQVAKDVGCLDWSKRFGEYADSRGSSSKSEPTASQRRRRSPLPNDARQHLEKTHASVVSKCVALEDKFQELSKQERVAKADALKFVRKSKKFVEDMQRALEKAEEKLSSVCGSADCALSSSSSSSSIELGSSPENSLTAFTVEAKRERSRDTPLPKPRKPKPPPPYKSQKEEYTTAVQECTRHNSPMLQKSVKDVHSGPCDQPPPLPPKKSSAPKQGQKQTATSQMCYATAPVCVRIQKRLSEDGQEVALEEGDPNDSGMESGSGSVQHGTLSEMREAMQNPPPEPHSSGQRYTAIMGETRDEEQVYHEVNR